MSYEFAHKFFIINIHNFRKKEEEERKDYEKVENKIKELEEDKKSDIEQPKEISAKDKDVDLPILEIEERIESEEEPKEEEKKIEKKDKKEDNKQVIIPLPTKIEEKENNEY